MKNRIMERAAARIRSVRSIGSARFPDGSEEGWRCENCKALVPFGAGEVVFTEDDVTLCRSCAKAMVIQDEIDDLPEVRAAREELSAAIHAVAGLRRDIIDSRLEGENQNIMELAARMAELGSRAVIARTRLHDATCRGAASVEARHREAN